MKFLKIAAWVVFALVILFVGFGLTLMDTLTLVRSTRVKAPIDLVWKRVNSLEATDAWSPWNDYDRDVVKTYEGTPGTVGSKQTWAGNSDIGTGTQEIISVSDKEIKTKLVFTSPWESISYASIKLEQEADSVRIDWNFYTETPFPSNVFYTLMNMKDFLSADYDKGLEKLKTTIEKDVEQFVIDGFYIEETEFPETNLIFHRSVQTFDNMGAYMTNTIDAIKAEAQKLDEPNDTIFGIFYEWNEKTMKTDFAVAIPVQKATSSTNKKFSFMTIPRVKAITTTYPTGNDSLSYKAHMALDAYFKKQGLKESTMVLEEYAQVGPKTVTPIYYLVQ